ncbi:alkaline phosphatase [Corynebacterium cystitidis]|uniref:alkaline phosphatase n=1 Tax=Corynebacterium cystitidis TaxID=35757 RepID=UPI00211E2C0B|nr:alkaline phosphatase [Corynebacterium cystitidis]
MRQHNRGLRVCAAITATALAVTTVLPAHADEKSGPKNIIYMIGDGMGYNHVAAVNLYESGQTRYQLDGPADPEQLTELPGDAVQAYEHFDLVGMATFQKDNHYDPIAAWSDHDWVKKNYTDSAAAGTAMATGVKVDNGTLAVDPAGNPLENASERAMDHDKAAGVVSSVPFSHATPAAWAAHNVSRNDYHAIAAEMLAGDLDVIMGAGHPFYDADNNKVAEPDYKYISEETYNDVMEGDKWNVVVDQAEFASLAAGVVEEDEQYFGLAPVASTLQHDRSGTPDELYVDPFNDVVDLGTMTKGALNVLGQDDDGFHLMVEGGAIDWAGHANTIGRDIEETIDFNEAVEVAIQWVEEHSSWEETLLVVTADHETGYLSGPEDQPGFTPMVGEKGQAPAHGYYSGDHTNHLVPFYFKGAGAEEIKAAATGNDPVRGAYIDNTTLAKLTMENWWTEVKQDDNGSSEDEGSTDIQAGSSEFGVLDKIIAVIRSFFASLGLGQFASQLSSLSS